VFIVFFFSRFLRDIGIYPHPKKSYLLYLFFSVLNFSAFCLYGHNTFRKNLLH
jgi:hypothetical protein